MPSPRFPIPQGTLDLLILQVLSLEAAHGYGIAQRLEQISRSVVRVNQGSLYPALHRLEQKEWLKAEWKPSETGREAKFYSLTRSGRKQLAAEKDSWARLPWVVQLILEGQYVMKQLLNWCRRGNLETAWSALRYHMDRRVSDWCNPVYRRKRRGEPHSNSAASRRFGRKCACG
jgi:transcriptional regulator